MRARRRIMVAVGLVALSIAAVLVTQRLLQAPTPAPVSSVTAAGITANCGMMTQDSSDSPITPTNGTILFGCAPRSGWPPTSLSCGGNCANAYPALNVSQTANYTAVFALTQYYTRLFIAGIGGCSQTGDPGTMSQLSSQAKIQLSGSSSSPGLYNYCASYAAIPSTGGTLPGFAISWRVGSTVVSQTFPSVTVPPRPPPTALSVVRGVDNSLYYATWAGSWNDWQSLGKTTFGSPVLCSGGGTTLFLAARTPDNYSTFVMSYSNGVWSELPNPGGQTNADPACASMNGTLYLLARGYDFSLYANSFNETLGSWAGWQKLPATLNSLPVLAASPGLNRLDVVVVGASGVVYHNAFTGGVWNAAWDNATGGTSSLTPAVVSDGRTLHVVVMGADQLYYDALNFATNKWSGWTKLGGSTAVTPSLVIDSSDTVHLFVAGLYGVIYYKSLSSGGTWTSNWNSQHPGGQSIYPIAATAQGSSILIMVGGTNGQIWYDRFSASVWQGWTPLVGSTPTEPALASIS